METRVTIAYMYIGTHVGFNNYTHLRLSLDIVKSVNQRTESTGLQSGHYKSGLRSDGVRV